MRTVDEILNGDALTWSKLTTEELRREHELLRRSLENARQQISVWAPFVAWRHRYEGKSTEEIFKEAASHDQVIKAAADLVVYGIVRDFTDRRGLRQEWEQIDDSVQREIRDTWKRIAVVKMKDAFFAASLRDSED